MKKKLLVLSTLLIAAVSAFSFIACENSGFANKYVYYETESTKYDITLENIEDPEKGLDLIFAAEMITVLERAGKGREAHKEQYRDTLKEWLDIEENGIKNADNLSVGTITKLAGALTACGYKNKVGDYDILTSLYDYDFIMGGWGLSDVCNALTALDYLRQEIPRTYKDYHGNEKTSTTTRDKLIEYILSDFSDEKNCWTDPWSGEASVNYTAAAIQALAPYKDRENVGEKIDKALTFLSAALTDDAGYVSDWTPGQYDVCGTAQAVIALNAVGIDAENDERFIKGESKSSMMTFINACRVNDEKSELYSQYYDNVNLDFTVPEGMTTSFATYQCHLAQASQMRLEIGKSAIYDMRDASIVSSAALITLFVFIGLFVAVTLSVIGFYGIQKIKEKKKERAADESKG